MAVIVVRESENSKHNGDVVRHESLYIAKAEEDPFHCKVRRDLPTYLFLLKLISYFESLRNPFDCIIATSIHTHTSAMTHTAP